MTHNDFVDLFWRKLMADGHRAASEVGVLNGRIDVVRLNAEDEWVELYEAKLRRPEDGIPQLERYGRAVKGTPKLTLLVPPWLCSDSLRAAASGRCDVLAFDASAGVQEPLFGSWRGFVALPYFAKAAA